MNEEEEKKDDLLPKLYLFIYLFCVLKSQTVLNFSQDQGQKLFFPGAIENISASPKS